jgi:hypothetical protein
MAQVALFLCSGLDWRLDLGCGGMCYANHRLRDNVVRKNDSVLPWLGRGATSEACCLVRVIGGGCKCFILWFLVAKFDYAIILSLGF